MRVAMETFPAVADRVGSMARRMAESELHYTIIFGPSSAVVRDILAHRLPYGGRILDMTFGKGAFWRGLDLGGYDVTGIDMKPDDDYVAIRDEMHDIKILGGRDFTCLWEFSNYRYDAVMFDPPFTHHPRKDSYFDRRYNGHATMAGLDHNGIVDQYRKGMAEGYRVLKPGGILVVKSQDEIESNRLRRTTMEVHKIATDELGMRDDGDRYQIPTVLPTVQNKQQRHAKRVGSIWWIFVKPASAREKEKRSVLDL